MPVIIEPEGASEWLGTDGANLLCPAADGPLAAEQ
jgi:hypothetical protein